jgi:hypothetical protein
MKNEVLWDQLASEFSARRIDSLSQVAGAHDIEIALIDRIIDNPVCEPVETLSRVLSGAAPETFN